MVAGTWAARYLNLKNLFSGAISTIVMLIVAMIQEDNFIRAETYLYYLIVFFVLYIIITLYDTIPRIAEWYNDIKNKKDEVKNQDVGRISST